MFKQFAHTRPFRALGRPHRIVVVGAKKGGKPQKGSALADFIKSKEQAVEVNKSLADEPAKPDQYANPESLMFLLLLTENFWKCTKRCLLENVDFEVLAEQLYRAPFAIAVHDKFDTPDFQFLYGNRRMLGLLDANWDQLIGTSSLKCANGLVEQDPFFSVVTNPPLPGQNFTQNYEGSLVSLQGKSFRVKDGIVFDMNGPEGEKLGQALYFTQYVLEDGTMVTMGADGDTVVAPPAAVPGKLKEAEVAVEKQAEIVRSLKEGQGLTNQDAPVQVAVAELKRLKERVAELQQLLEAATPKAA